ncbi:MAG: 3-deoxy-D-manno-octulosonic acid transferase [Armatimonadota bacterium]
MFILYNLALTLLSPIWVPWMIWRTRKRQEAPNWKERSGNYDGVVNVRDKKKNRVWVHAVSVGEVIAAKPFLSQLRQLAPECEIVLSVTTSSGHQTAREMEMPLFDSLVYFPIDVPKFTLRAMQWVRPDVMVIMETELWYNFLWAADVFDVRTMIVNGRISDKAYKTDLKVGFFFRSLFKLMNRCLVQTETDKDRFESLGAKGVEVFGNTKFDEASSVVSVDANEWREKLGIPTSKRVIVVGSTRSELEEQLVVDAFFQLKDVVFVHAPRHIESAGRIIEVFQKQVGSSGKSIGRRSLGESGDYVVLDTFGELGSVYSIADVVVIGGGFDKLGGQNLIQPLALSKPVIHGPNMFNFRDVAASSVRAGCSIICESSNEVATQIQSLLNDDERRKVMADAAKKLIADNVGASRRYAEAVIAEMNAVKR